MIDGIRYAVFNATNFEGETTENRLARRRRNWTPEAVCTEGEDWAASH